MRAPVLSPQLLNWLEMWVSEVTEDTALVVMFDSDYRWERGATLKEQLHELVGFKCITIFVEPVKVDGFGQQALNAKEGNNRRENEDKKEILRFAPVHAGSTESFSAGQWGRWGINE
jgi:hypothetical protein